MQNKKTAKNSGAENFATTDFSTIIREFFYKLQYTEASEDLEAEKNWQDILNRIYSCFISLSSSESSEEIDNSKQNLALLYQELHEDLASYITAHYNEKFYIDNRKDLEYEWDNYIQKIIAEQIKQKDISSDLEINTSEAAKKYFGPYSQEESILEKVNKKDSELLKTIENQQDFIYDLLDKIYQGETVSDEETDKARTLLEGWIALGTSKLYSGRQKNYKNVRGKLANELIEMLSSNFKDYLQTNYSGQIIEGITGIVKTAFGDPEKYLTPYTSKYEAINNHNTSKAEAGVRRAGPAQNNEKDGSTGSEPGKTEEEANLETELGGATSPGQNGNLWQKFKNIFSLK
jgi:hypothetical protein